MIMATGTFTGIAIATGSLTSSLKNIGAWSNISPALNAVAILTEAATVTMLVVFAIRPLHKIVGLVERGIYLGNLLWLGLLFAHLCSLFDRVVRHMPGTTAPCFCKEKVLYLSYINYFIRSL